jgi:hypothetical protein
MGVLAERGWGDDRHCLPDTCRDMLGAPHGVLVPHMEWEEQVCFP